MTVKIEEGLRRQIARFLPDAFAKALTSYQDFSMRDIDAGSSKSDAKKFSEYHAACKVAIAHLELLLKLARFADLPDANAPDHNQQILLAAMMQEAEGQLSAYRTQLETGPLADIGDADCSIDDE